MADGALLQIVFLVVAPWVLPDRGYQAAVMGSLGLWAAGLWAAARLPLPASARAGGLVANLLGLALGGLALFGPGSGAVLFGGTSLVVARVFLGPTLMWGVAAALMVGLGVIATGFVQRLIPWDVPVPMVSLFSQEAWTRTSISGLLGAIWLVRLVSVLIGQMERSHYENVDLLRRAERAVLVRDRFLQLASHELRTPLTALLWASEYISDLRRGTLSEGRLERIAGSIIRNIERLHVLVVQLVDAAAIEAGTLSLNLGDHDLVALVRRVVQRFDGQPPRTAVIDLFLPDELWGTWDASRLELVVHNLVANALRFGEGGPVSVSLYPGQRIVFTVSDHGKGISAEQLPHLFERFHESESAAPSSGLGLGLFMVRAIVEAHGGTVRVDSQVGRGSTFTVELPRTARWVAGESS